MMELGCTERATGDLVVWALEDKPHGSEEKGRGELHFPENVECKYFQGGQRQRERKGIGWEVCALRHIYGMKVDASLVHNTLQKSVFFS